jgi:hypothetical protein
MKLSSTGLYDGAGNERLLAGTHVLEDTMHGQHWKIAGVGKLVVHIVELGQCPFLLANMVGNYLDVAGTEGCAVQVEDFLAREDGHDPPYIHGVEDLEQIQPIGSSELLPREWLVAAKEKEREKGACGSALAYDTLLGNLFQKPLGAKPKHEKAHQGGLDRKVALPDLLWEKVPHADLEAVSFDERVTPSVPLPFRSDLLPEGVT